MHVRLEEQQVATVTAAGTSHRQHTWECRQVASMPSTLPCTHLHGMHGAGGDGGLAGEARHPRQRVAQVEGRQQWVVVHSTAKAQRAVAATPARVEEEWGRAECAVGWAGGSSAAAMQGGRAGMNIPPASRTHAPLLSARLRSQSRTSPLCVPASTTCCPGASWAA